ncbi:MAG: ABC transporter ATP-binding protein [Burkholderiales bacterium]
MSSDLAVHAEGVAKSFRLFAKPRDRLKQLFAGSRRKYYQEFWALRDVGFDVARGETVGIIGRNGSGKSTLLQIVCGTLRPTAGRVQTHGRIAAMLELGAGFSPEFSGRENIFLNGYIVGLTQQQIEARYDAICAFADIGEFIDQPIKTYSTGMAVRLAFAVMAHVDADILVIDEALAVGDARFVQKCMRFLREFKERGTLLFVSHDTTAVANLCDRVIWLDGGRLKANGPAKEVCDMYLENLFESVQGASRAAEPAQRADAAKDTAPARDQRLDILQASPYRNDVEIFEFHREAASFGKRGARILDVRFEHPHGERLAWAVGGETVVVAIDIEALLPLARPIVGFLVRDRLGQNVFGDNTFLTTQDAPLTLAPGDTAGARFEFDLPLLPPGDYSIAVAVADGRQDDHVQHEWIHDALTFRVETSSVRHSLVGLPMRGIRFERIAHASAPVPAQAPADASR